MPRRYANDPLIEAVVELRFVPGRPWDGTEPGLLYERLKPLFPGRESGVSVDVRQDFDAQERQLSQHIAPRPEWRFLRDDKRVFVRLAPNLLSVHSLTPYVGWDELCPLVIDSIDKYREVAEPSAIARAGILYLNRFRLEAPAELSDFLDFYPYSGNQLPADSFDMSAVLHFPYDGGGNLMRARVWDEHSGDPAVVAISLDFDYFTASPEVISWDELPTWLDLGHERANSVFEGSIKAPLRDRFEPLDGDPQ